jgi:hypothetical protein
MALAPPSEQWMATSRSLTPRLPARSSISRRRMSLTRLTMVMSTAWHSCLPPEKVRPPQPAKTSCSLPGAVMRQSRCVAQKCHKSLEDAWDIVVTGVEVLSQQARAPQYHRMYSRRHSLPCHTRGYHICRLPGRICPRVGLADQYVHPNHHRSGGRRSLIFILSCCIPARIERGHLVTLNPRI